MPGTADDKEAQLLKLQARDVEDLAVISAMVQDALAPLGDAAFLADEGRFVMALNRFRWEREQRSEALERIHSGLRFEKVKAAKFRGIDRRNRGQFLSILAIAYADSVVVLHCAGGGAIRLEVDELCCVLEDFGEPWPTPVRPKHEVE